MVRAVQRSLSLSLSAVPCCADRRTLSMLRAVAALALAHRPASVASSVRCAPRSATVTALAATSAAAAHVGCAARPLHTPAQPAATSPPHSQQAAPQWQTQPQPQQQQQTYNAQQTFAQTRTRPTAAAGTLATQQRNNAAASTDDAAPTADSSSRSSSSSSPSARSPRLRPADPFVVHPERPWLFAPFARANDFEGAWNLMEERARSKLREAEQQKLRERQERMDAARARGEEPEPEIDEHTLPWKSLTKKARKRVRSLLLSTDPAIRILKTVPKQEMVDCLQAFAAEAQETGMEYCYRRMNQMGVPFDEEIASRWMGGIITAAARRREMEATKIYAQKQLEAAAAGTDAETAAAASVPHAGHRPRQRLRELTPGQLDLRPETIQRHDPVSVVAARATPSALALGVGLPCSKLVRAQVDLVMGWMDRYAQIPSFRVVRQIFEALAIDNDIHGGLAFITRLARMKYYVSGFTYALLIEALAKYQQSEGVMFVFLHMERARFAPHAQTFNSLIASFAGLGDYKTSYRLMQDMIKAGCTPNNATFASLIEACVRGDNLELGLEMFEYFRTWHRTLTVAVSDRNRNKNIKLVGLENAPDDVRIKQPLALGREPFEAIMHGYLSKSQLAKALEVVNDMVAQGIAPSARTYSILLEAVRTAYANPAQQATMPAQASSETDTADAAAAPPASASAPATAAADTVDSASVRARKSLDVACQLWVQALGIGVHPTVRMYTAFMRHQLSFEDVKHLYDEMVLGSETVAQQQKNKTDAVAVDEKTEVVAADALQSPSTFHAPLRPNLAVFQILISALAQEVSATPAVATAAASPSSSRALSTIPWLFSALRRFHIAPNWALVLEVAALLERLGLGPGAREIKRAFWSQGEAAFTEEFVNALCTPEGNRALQGERKKQLQAQSGAAASQQPQPHHSRRKPSLQQDLQSVQSVVDEFEQPSEAAPQQPSNASTRVV